MNRLTTIEAQAYKQGQLAYHSKQSCPYDIGEPLRTQWWIGYLDERFKLKYGHIK